MGEWKEGEQRTREGRRTSGQQEGKGKTEDIGKER